MGDDSLLALSTAILAEAEARGREAAQTEPRVASARYDGESGRIVIDLTNGCTFAFPPRLVQGLDDVAEADLAAIEVLGEGYGLHWEGPDVDISIPGLMMGLSGGRPRKAG